ncbi:branched-chain amino acid aminotransferase II [Aspergillus steynii IBT 23096]|uniref:Branched-chain-amino-acid aminotransferase n=1 Tax=Aspergillus steynii IBT 23096 TaxID=1392250 RepID=A0A2I2G4J3_9EURO|nr:branched-chain amino acid aminotransferase II [Aspergillus steynii IBT 23096]PLB47800.1 branched-chain amino acid aminotransferase II [Aspergillus steynii IBT 23096]
MSSSTSSSQDFLPSWTGPSFDTSRLKTELTSNPAQVPEPDSPEVLARSVCTDHMAVVRWNQTDGWADPELIPYGAISMMPTASVFHYSTACFEGMKVYRGHDGNLRLFRPQYNCARMLASALRIGLPEFDPAQLLDLIRELCAVECPKWLPKDRAGECLYLRPTLVGTDANLGFQVPREAMLFIVVSFWPNPKPAPSLGETGSAPQTKSLRLLSSREGMVRAWPGGTGSAKISANYGPSLLAHGEAKSKGFDQVLWLFGPEGYVTEAGSSNLFVIWRNSEGKLELVTAPLTEHTILAGVTRQSILDLARERLTGGWSYRWDGEPLDVVETKFTVFDIIKASEQGRLISSFVVGTACFLVPVSHIEFSGRGIDIPQDATAHVSALRKWMTDITTGVENSNWGDVVREKVVTL